jgi:hypothetical protein
MGFPFHQHLSDFTPLLKQESVFDPLVGTIMQFSTVEKVLDCRLKHVQQGFSRSVDDVNVNVRGRSRRPLEEKFGCTGSHRDRRHDWCYSLIILDIGTGTIFQEELNKVQVGHHARVACNMQGRNTVWLRVEVGVGSVSE